MIENLLNECNSLNEKQKSILDNYSLKDLFDLYITYAKPKYFKNHKNMKDILNYISSYIINNFSKNDFLENMNLYSKILVELINIEDIIKATNNIINIRTQNLKDDFFLEFEAKTYNLKKAEYIKKYEKELNDFKIDFIYYKEIANLLDNLQKELFNYINNYIEQLDDEDKKIFLQKINAQIEDNYIEIVRRMELKQDKKRLNIESRFKDISVSELLNSLNTTYLDQQNYVYINFQNVIKELLNKKNK